MKNKSASQVQRKKKGFERRVAVSVGGVICSNFVCRKVFGYRYIFTLLPLNPIRSGRLLPSTWIYFFLKIRTGLLYVSCTLIWGCSFILMKMGLEVYSPDEVAALRLMFGGMCLFPISIPLIIKEIRRRVPHRNWAALGISSFAGNIVPAFLFATAQNHLKSATGGVLNSLTPIFTLLVGAAFFGGKFTPGVIAGVLTGLAGACAIVLLKTGATLTESEPEFALLIVIATLLYGFNGNFVKARLDKLKALHLVSLVFFIGAVPATVYVMSGNIFTKTFAHPSGFRSLLAIATLGCIGTALATYLFWKMAEYSSLIFAASVTYCIPIVALAIGYFVRGEAITIGHGLGLIGILTGVWLINRKK